MKSDEQIAKELQDEDLRGEEFKEVAIQDRTNELPLHSLQPISNGPAPFYDNHAGFSPMPLPANNIQQVPAVIIDPVPLNPKYLKVLKFASTTKWIAILDCLLCFIYILTGLFVLILLIFLPVLGYFGGAKLLRPLLVAYMIYQILVTILRIALIAIADNAIYTVLTVFIIIFTIAIFVFLVKFFRLLGDVTPQERLEILELMKGNRGARQPAMNNPPQIVYGIPAQYPPQQYQPQQYQPQQYQAQQYQPQQPAQPYFPGTGYKLDN
ncbi:unnamed protein product [Blepharisma stoltei]|uniref:Uncharacterized protein n=1 Tax=Blepharisma stoltei TaxID=1481888 RepID=A0AAU9JDR5_9CILI|nr:unnamed protein product [Blepharisma stoltei]